MNRLYYSIIIFLFLSCCNSKPGNATGCINEETTSQSKCEYDSDLNYVSAIFQPEQLQFTWSGVSGTPTTFAMVKDGLPNGKKLIFACNGGMYMGNYRPIGLFVKEGTTLTKICPPGNNTGNYNLGFGDEKVNGIFVINKQGTASIIKSSTYEQVKSSIQQATQSGPLLLWEGKINPNFSKGSNNRLLRNGVGIMPDGKVVFIMADDICFYDFATLFRDKYHCQNALYLDGVISKTYYPSKGFKELSGGFGVVIYVTD